MSFRPVGNRANPNSKAALSGLNRKLGSNLNNGVYSTYGSNDNPPDANRSPNDVENDAEVANINARFGTEPPHPSNEPADRLQLEYTNFVPQNLRLNWSSAMGNIGEFFKHGNIEEFAEENPSEFGIKKPKSTNAKETVGNGEEIVRYENPMQPYNNVRNADNYVVDAANSAEDSPDSEVSGGANVAKGGANGSDERQDYYMMSVKILDRARWNQKIREYIERTRIPPLSDESTNINAPLTPPRDLYEELLTDIINDGRIVSVRYVDLPDNAARFSVQNVPGIRVWDERPASQEADTSQGTDETAMQPSGSEATMGVAETSEKVEEPLEEIQPPAAAAAAAPEPEEIPEQFREAHDIFFGMPETFLVLVGCEYDNELFDPRENNRAGKTKIGQDPKKYFEFYLRFTKKRFGWKAPKTDPMFFPRTFLALEWLILDLCNIMSGNINLVSSTNGVNWTDRNYYPQWKQVMPFPDLPNNIKNNQTCKKMPSLENRLKRITHVRHELFHGKKTSPAEIDLLVKFFTDKAFGAEHVLICLRTLFVDFLKIILLFLGAKWRGLISGAYEPNTGTNLPTNDKKNPRETIGLKLNSIKTKLLGDDAKLGPLEKIANQLGVVLQNGEYVGETPTTAEISSKENLQELFGYINEILTEIVSPFSLLH